MGLNGIGWLVAVGLSALATAITYLWPAARGFGYLLFIIGVLAFAVAVFGAIRFGWPQVKAMSVRLGVLNTALLIGVVGAWVLLPPTIGAVTWILLHQGEEAKTSTSDDGPLRWFANLEMEGGPPLGRPVYSLTFHGGNTSQREVSLKKANIVSALNGKKIDLEIAAQDDAGKGDIVSIEAINLIPPGAPVHLVAKFGDPDPNAPGKILGMDAKTFLETWRQFYFNVEDDTKTYRLPYNEGNLMSFFPGMVGPHVTKKHAAIPATNAQ
jgi:hypothetical protein